MSEDAVTSTTKSPVKMEEAAAPSTSTEQTEEVDLGAEAKKLLGVGHRHLVMKDVQSAVNAFQEASSLLAKKHGETADECGEAFFSYGMSLLELARMENGVLGNALEGMPEDEEAGEKEEDPNIPSATNLDEKEREQLREQVYDAMAEDEVKATNGSTKTEEKEDVGAKEETGKNDVDMEECNKNESAEKANAETPDKTEEDKKTEHEESKAEKTEVEKDDTFEKTTEAKDDTLEKMEEKDDTLEETTEAKDDTLEKMEEKDDTLEETTEAKDDTLEKMEEKDDTLEEATEAKDDKLETTEAKDDKLEETTEAKDDKLEETTEAKDDKLEETTEAKDDKLEETTEAKDDKLEETTEAKDDKLEETTEAKDDKLEETTEAKDDKLEETAEAKDDKLEEAAKDDKLEEAAKDDKLEEAAKDDKLEEAAKDDKLEEAAKDDKLEEAAKDDKLEEAAKDDKLEEAAKDDKLEKTTEDKDKLETMEEKDDKTEKMEEEKLEKAEVEDKLEKMEENLEKTNTAAAQKDIKVAEDVETSKADPALAECEEKLKEDEAEDQEQMECDEEEGDGAESEENDTVEHDATEEKEDEEEVGNLQLAWEMLDLSKIIFLRQKTKDAQLKAAQAHLKLGEVSVESENYNQAVEDFMSCLNIQKEHLEEHDRLLAETHYQLGLAYQYSSKHEEAISHFTQSVQVIEKRMVVLTDNLKKAGEEPAVELQKEMDELKGLLPDIKEKIDDSKEAQRTAKLTEMALKETLAGSSGFSQENGSTSAFASSLEKSKDAAIPATNCVSDISHLVRKKRKPEEESPLKDNEAKKSKQELVENGAGNGDAVVPNNEDVEKAEEAEQQTPMETAAVESTA